MSDAKKAKVDVEAEAGGAATEEAAQAADPGADGQQQEAPGFDYDGEENVWDGDEGYTEDEIVDQAAIEDNMQAVAALQRQLLEVNDEASDKVLQVEVEYNQKRHPIYVERSQHFRRLPDFWPTVLLQQEVLRELITVEDEEALRYLVDVFVEDAADIKSGYSIFFHFAEGNAFFQNETLEKKYVFYDDGTAEVTDVAPAWYPGKCLTEDVEGSDVEVEGRKRKRVRDSFFLWFEEDVPRQDAASAEDPVADIIKEQIWPNPLLLYQQAQEEADAAEEDAAGGADNPIVLEDDDDEEYGYEGEEGAEGEEGGEQQEGYYEGEEGAEGEEGEGAEAELGEELAELEKGADEGDVEATEEEGAEAA